MDIGFEALDYHADNRFRPASYRFRGDVTSGWQVRRDSEPVLELGRGYRPLRVLACGVCSTDLARRFLPFPLPQIIGHELVARDDEGNRVLVEINASHRSRGIEGGCAFCRSGLDHHCPERLVLGIHDLPGGFGPRVLAPVGNVLPVPDALTTDTASLAEPFAAALNAVDRLELGSIGSVAVLGPRRLGMLVIAALRARREQRCQGYEIVALARRQRLRDLAIELGADRGIVVEGKGEALPSELADVVVDTTGTASGFELALRLARREVHVKSTHGQRAGGLEHLTELVVDELAIVPADSEPGDGDVLDLTGPVDARRARECWEVLQTRDEQCLPRHRAVIVDHAGAIDLAIRPLEGRETSLVAPRGEVQLAPGSQPPRTAVERAVLERGLRISSSRCGEFREALALLESDRDLGCLADRMITHRFPARELASGFEAAARPDCLKALILHDSG